MWNEPSNADLASMPDLYATEKTPWERKLVYVHFFLGSCDWFMVERCPDSDLYFGFVVLNGDLMNAEWGYVDGLALRCLVVQGVHVDRDLHWRVRPAGEVDLIRLALRPGEPHVNDSQSCIAIEHVITDEGGVDPRSN